MAQLSAWHVTDHYPDRDTARNIFRCFAGETFATFERGRRVIHEAARGASRICHLTRSSVAGTTASMPRGRPRGRLDPDSVPRRDPPDLSDGHRCGLRAQFASSPTQSTCLTAPALVVELSPPVRLLDWLNPIRAPSRFRTCVYLSHPYSTSAPMVPVPASAGCAAGRAARRGSLDHS
jgi:hypothetical protein